jgi:hypothetical protein
MSYEPELFDQNFLDTLCNIVTRRRLQLIRWWRLGQGDDNDEALIVQLVIKIKIQIKNHFKKRRLQQLDSPLRQQSGPQF